MQAIFSIEFVLPGSYIDRLCVIVGLCAGKHEVANYLVQDHNFQVLTLKTPAPPSQSRDGEEAFLSPEELPISSTLVDDSGRGAICFFSAEDLLEYVTKRWRERFVTTDIWDEKVLDLLLRRPFFILVSVDAPVIVRWKRYKARYAFFTPVLKGRFLTRRDTQM